MGTAIAVIAATLYLCHHVRKTAEWLVSECEAKRNLDAHAYRNGYRDWAHMRPVYVKMGVL